MNINAIDLRQLRYFIAVAEELHFGRAAKRLNLSQPPLSQQIMALETYLGVTLFKRTSRHVELTAAGAHFLPEARRLVREVAQAAERTKQIEAGLIGHLRIGFNFSAPLHPFTAKLLKRFRVRFPQIQLELVVHEPSNILQLVDIASRDLDAALVWLDADHKKTDIFRLDLAKDILQVAVSSDHPLAKEPRIPIQDLFDLPILAPPRHAGTQLYEGIVAAFKAYDRQPKLLHEAIQLPLTMSMVAAGQGVALLPAFMKRVPIDDVTFRPLVMSRGKPPSMTFNLISAYKRQAPAIAHFIEQARQLAKL